MEKDTGPKQPPRTRDESLQSPHPPAQVLENTPEAQEPINEEPANEEKTNSGQAKNYPDMAEKVQDHDWNNGRPEVTPEHVEPLPGHVNPEIGVDKSLRENKGEKPGDKSFEASEEVNTGQNAG